MISSQYNRAFLIIAASATVMLIPTAAHASALDWGASLFGLDLHDSMGTAFIKVFVGLLQTIQNSLISGIAYLSKALSWAISLRPDGGGPVIYGAWKVFRDLCNLAFIIVIIMSSFATVFKTFEFGWLKPYAMPNKTLIFGFLAAAIFINFSLAIGQSIVAISNYVTGMMIEILPNDVGGQIGLRLNAVAALAGKAPAVIVDPARERPITNPSVLQDSATLKQKANSKWETMMLGSYLNCLNISGFWVNNQKCYEDAVHQGGLLPYPDVATANQRQYSTASGNPPSVREVGGFLQVLSGNGDFVLESDYQRLALESVAIRPITDVADDAAKIPSIMYSIFLYLVIALSFLVVIVFSLIRIPILWLILAFSPIAWIGLIFPGTDWWKKWWKEFVAWNLFSPMYLFIIYIGLYLLGQQNALLASLGTNGSPVDAQVGALLFYVMVGMIFIGGSAGVLSFARTGGTVAGGVIGGIQGSLGIKGTYGAAGAIYRGSGLKTEVESRYKGAVAGLETLQQKYIAQPRIQREQELERRFKTRFGTSEERKKFESEQITQKQAALQKDLDARLGTLKSSLSQAKDETERTKLQGQIKLTEQQNFDQLRKTMASGRRTPESLAAAEILLSKGKLSPEEIRTLGEDYRRISPAAMQEFITRRDKQIIEDAEKRKYADAAELQKYMEVLGDPKQMEKFLDSARKGKNKVTALEAAGNLKVVQRGGKALTATELISEASPNFTGEDWAGAEEFYNRTGNTMSDETARAYRATLSNRQKSSELLKSVTNPTQHSRIHGDLLMEGAAALKKEQTLDGLQKSSRKLAQKSKDVREQAKRSRDPDEQKRLRKLAEQIDDRRDRVQKKIDTIRRP